MECEPKALREKLEELERRLHGLEAALAAPPPPTVRLHPNCRRCIAARFRACRSLSHPESRTQALEIVRCLFEQGRVRTDAGKTARGVEGA